MTARSLICGAFVGALLTVSSFAVAADSASPIVGRWDLTIQDGQKEKPSWLGVTMKDGKLEGTFVGTGGGVHDVSEVKFENDKLSFREGNGSFEATLTGDKLTGEITHKDGNKSKFAGRRFVAKPESSAKPEWGEPIALFDGKDFGNWEPLGDEKGFGNWKVQDGVMVNSDRGANIRTKAVFRDFKLHVEFSVPEHGNSGVYLRGRYEIQVEDSFGKPVTASSCGALYSRIAPSENASKKPGEWQAFDITLVGQRVTVALNGKTIIDNKEIEGITGGAIDSRESAPGPVYLQGDHSAVKYRNIVLTPTKGAEKANERKPAGQKAPAKAE